MKKYLLGISVVLLAIGFSAFTTKPTTSAKKFSPLYWYKTNDAGTSLVSFIGNEEKAQAMEDTDCDDTQTEPFCALGYDTPQDLGAAPSTNLVIKKRPQN